MEQRLARSRCFCGLFVFEHFFYSSAKYILRIPNLCVNKIFMLFLTNLCITFGPVSPLGRFNNQTVHCYDWLMRDFGDNVFEGTAGYYAKYRPTYPKQLFDDIIEAFELNGQGSLLDLGCGTGEMAIPLAPYFKNVLAIDPDRQMLDYGRRKTAAQKINNIEWQKGSSKTLTEVNRLFKMVTMGQSFHWMDEKIVIDKLYGMLEPGGVLVIVGNAAESVLQNVRAARKNEIVKKMLVKYLGPERRAGNKIYKPSSLDWQKDLFPKTRFGNFQTAYYLVQIPRNIDQIVGQLFSMSWAARRHFGDRIVDFENEIRRELNQSLGSKKIIEKFCFRVDALVKK
jgi:ubiquinone/menaquinone biosynthesis C-methylase UbiE